MKLQNTKTVLLHFGQKRKEELDMSSFSFEIEKGRQVRPFIFLYGYSFGQQDKNLDLK